MIPRGKLLEPGALGASIDAVSATIELLADGRAIAHVGGIGSIYASEARAREGIASLQRMGVVRMNREAGPC